MWCLKSHCTLRIGLIFCTRLSSNGSCQISPRTQRLPLQKELHQTESLFPLPAKHLFHDKARTSATPTDSELRWAQLTCDVMKRGWNMSKPVETTCMLLYVAFSIQCTMTHPIFQLSMLRIVEPGRSYPVIPELTPLTSLTPSAPSCRKLSFWSFWSTDCWWPLETTHTLSFLCTSQLLRGLPNEATASLNWKFRDIAEWLDTTNTKKPLLNVKRFFGPKSVLQNLWVSFSNSQS